MNFLNNYKEHSYALMRIVTGYLFLWHGTQKFFDFPKEWPWGLDLRPNSVHSRYWQSFPAALPINKGEKSC